MNENEPHVMTLVKTYDDGTEEWFCPVCGRHFKMTWPPHYTKEVLETGDEYAAHVCGKGGLSMGAPIIGTGETREDGSCGVTDLFQVAAPAVPAPMPVEEPGEVPLTPELAPWLRYINNLAGTYFWLSND